MKKIVCIVLSFIMIMGVLTGCGEKDSKASYKDDPDKEVTLVIAAGTTEMADSQKVIDAINKELETLLPNTKIEFLYGDLVEKWPMLMATNKEIDLAHSGFYTDLEAEVTKGNYLPLNDMVKEYAPELQKLQEKYWNAYDNATVNGDLYAVPNVQMYAKAGLALRIFSEAAPYMDINAMREEAWSNDKTTEKFWALFSEGLDKATAAGVDCKACISDTLYNMAKRGYVFIGGEDSNICYEASRDATIIDYYTTDEFKTFSHYMKKWYDKGYVSKDILAGAWTDKTYCEMTYYYGYNEETGIKEKYASETCVTLQVENLANKTLVTDIGDQSTYWSVPYTAQNPARAIRFLDLLHSEKGAIIANLMAYGIEGTHYEVKDAEKGVIDAFEYGGQPTSSASYGIANWSVANMMEGMYVIDPYDADFKEWAISYYASLKDLKKHQLYGYSFDISSVQSELNTIAKNNAEYAKMIYLGIESDFDGSVATLFNKNKAAGQEKVIEELQSQADKYIQDNE